MLLGPSTDNDGGRPVGVVGENDLTLGGAFSLGKSIAFPNLATGTLTFGGTVSVSTRTLTFQGTGNTVFSASMRTLKLTSDGPGQALTMTSGNLTLNAGGLLFLGAHDYAIAGNSLVYTGGLCVHHHGSGALTLQSKLGGRTRSTLPARFCGAL